MYKGIVNSLYIFDIIGDHHLIRMFNNLKWIQKQICWDSNVLVSDKFLILNLCSCIIENGVWGKTNLDNMFLLTS